MTSANIQKIQNINDKTNKLAVSKMQDKTYRVPTKSFIELKANIYIYVTKDQHERRRAKVVNNSVAEDELIYENYKNATNMNHEMN